MTESLAKKHFLFLLV